MCSLLKSVQKNSLHGDVFSHRTAVTVAEHLPTWPLLDERSQVKRRNSLSCGATTIAGGIYRGNTSCQPCYHNLPSLGTWKNVLLVFLVSSCNTNSERSTEGLLYWALVLKEPDQWTVMLKKSILPQHNRMKLIKHKFNAQ